MLYGNGKVGHIVSDTDIHRGHTKILHVLQIGQPVSIPEHRATIRIEADGHHFQALFTGQRFLEQRLGFSKSCLALGNGIAFRLRTERDCEAFEFLDSIQEWHTIGIDTDGRADLPDPLLGLRIAQIPERFAATEDIHIHIGFGGNETFQIELAPISELGHGRNIHTAHLRELKIGAVIVRTKESDALYSEIPERCGRSGLRNHASRHLIQLHGDVTEIGERPPRSSRRSSRSLRQSSTAHQR